MASYKVKVVKKDGREEMKSISANSEDEARNKALMQSNVAEVIAVVKAW